MAIAAPALSIAVEVLFGHIRPTILNLQKLGTTDFSAEAPNVDIQPGKTIKVPVSSVAGASPYNAITNNYTTGGTTSWAELTATHYLQGFDVAGVDIDAGVNAPRIEQLFSRRAASGVVVACSAVAVAALDAVTDSTGITLPAAPTLAEYAGLFGQIEAKNKINAIGSVLAVSGAELGAIKAAFLAAGVSPGKNEELAQMLGFSDIVVVPGATGRLWAVPPSAFGTLARVPTYIAKYVSAGAETDPETGLALGIVVADDQSGNRRIVNADIWFGATAVSANAAATTAGIVKVGTAAG